MREIKFRAWDKENKEMLGVESLYWNEITEEFLIRTTMYSDYFGTDDMILMQYTGLKDKNGVEIYEGDIVKVYCHGEYVIGKVIYEHCGFTVDVMNNKELEYGRVNILETFVEVIGNIYDNSELIEKEGK